MRLTLFGLALLNSVLVTGLFAEEGKTFEEHKAKMLQRVEQHIGRLTEHKSCVSAATKKEDLKACHEKMKAWREANQHHKEDQH